MAATSNVGKDVVTSDGQHARIVWDGGAKSPKGGFTKGELLDDFKSRDSLHHLREMYAKHGVPQPQPLSDEAEPQTTGD